MGQYVNKGNLDFAEARDGKYVDKSGLIAFVNGTLSIQKRMTCVSREDSQRTARTTWVQGRYFTEAARQILDSSLKIESSIV